MTKTTKSVIERSQKQNEKEQKRMSNFLQVNKDLFGSGLDPVALLVLSQVQEFHRNKAVCYMTDAAMAKNFGTSAKTISRRLDELEVKGYIKRQSKYVGGKMQRTIVPVIKGVKDTADKLSVENKQADKLSPNFNETVEAKQLVGDKLSAEGDNLSISNRQNDPIKYNIKDNIKDNNQDYSNSPARKLAVGLNNPSTELSRPEEEENQEPKEQEERKKKLDEEYAAIAKEEPKSMVERCTDANGNFVF